MDLFLQRMSLSFRRNWATLGIVGVDFGALMRFFAIRKGVQGLMLLI